jgi:hypothetical protein
MPALHHLAALWLLLLMGMLMGMQQPLTLTMVALVVVGWRLVAMLTLAMGLVQQTSTH